MSDSWKSALKFNDTTRSFWSSEPDIIDAGQVWRARWESSGVLLVLLEVFDDTILAAPVTGDPETAAPEAVRLPEDWTTIQTQLWVWPGLQGRLPIRVLDRCLGRLNTTNPVAKLIAPDTPPGGSRWALHASCEERGRLEDEMAALTEAAWAPSGNGRLKELLDSSRVSSDVLRSLPGMRPAEVLATRRGLRPLAGPQIEALAEATGTPASAWWDANPRLPEALIRELDQPSVRRAILARAGHYEPDEAEERRRVAYEVYALAARQTGAQDSIDWAGRLRQYLHARQKTRS